MLFGPLLEPEGCWDSGDARCVSARCIRALDQFCKFDKVRCVCCWCGGGGMGSLRGEVRVGWKYQEQGVWE
jgi:hypothetical protein